MNKIAAYELLLENHPLWTKEADVLFGPKDDKNAVITAGGIFVGVPGDEKDSGYGAKARKAANRIQALISEKGSLQRARQAYEKENPSHFVTLALKRESKPSSGVLGSLFQGEKQKSSLKSYADRSKNPRIFVRSGPSAGYAQNAFYREVARGLYDRELNQPHVPKKDRVVYL